uniref:Erythromycin esterase n=1 Tax=viral metagenome TaxID=1070528 RepID=A0A6C0JBP7_9ZZZZ
MNLTDNEINNIDNIVYNISENIDFLSDPKQLLDIIPDDNQIVLLGECTHGTHEFYDIRNRLTQSLIQEKGYDIVLLEAEWPDIYRVNKYINKQNNDQTAKESLSNINKFPLWMWKNNIIEDLIEWLRKYNIIMKERQNKPAYIFGMDCQQFLKSYNDLKKYLDEIDPQFSLYLKRLFIFLKNINSEHEYGNSIVNGDLKKYIDTIPEILQDFLTNFQWDKIEQYLDNMEELSLDPIDIISAEQNAEIIVNAEEYFRKMVSEPPGSQVSWNTRDQHMLMTIMKLRNRFEKIDKKGNIPKIIVWAHNSHIGNANATNRGGKEFLNNNTWNLGQMVKENFPKSTVIGFYTNSGTVTAASNGNKSHETYTLNPASYYSYEYFFHKVSQKKQFSKYFINLKSYSNEEFYGLSTKDINNLPLNVQYRTLHNNCKITEEFDLDSKIVNEKLEEGYRFIPIERKVDKYGITRLLINNIGWITEHIPYSPITINCLPVNTLFYQELPKFFNSNLLQRWIGVQYCKNTEIQSHYGNSCLAKQYDYVVYLDKTNAINPI